VALYLRPASKNLLRDSGRRRASLSCRLRPASQRFLHDGRADGASLADNRGRYLS